MLVIHADLFPPFHVVCWWKTLLSTTYYWQGTLVFFLNLHLPLRPDSASSSVTSVPSQSRLSSALYWLCGMERRTPGETAPPAPVPPLSQDPARLLQEESCMRHAVNFNLIVCMSVTVFFIGYWAWTEDAEQPIIRPVQFFDGHWGSSSISVWEWLAFSAPPLFDLLIKGVAIH